MNPKALIPLILGLGIAGLAGKLGLDSIRNARADSGEKVAVWAAAVDIPRGTAINEAMLKQVNFPSTALPQGAIKDKKLLIGRVPKLVAPAGLPILSSMLSPEGTPPGVFVPPGLRAVAVKIDESSGVDNHLQPGVRVDVVGFFQQRTRGANDTIARTILENVEVAAVGDRLSVGGTQEPAEDDAKNKSRTTARPPRAVTLLVKPDNVPLLHLAEQRGKIKLSMRGAADSEGMDTSVARVSDRDILGLTGGANEEQGQEGWLSKFVQNLVPPAGADAAAAGPVMPEIKPVEKPKPAWTMRILNGEQIKVLAWTTMTSMEPVELSATAPSLFEDTPAAVQPPPPIPAETPEPLPVPEPKPEERLE